MKGALTSINRAVKLQDILVGECFMFVDQKDVKMRIETDDSFLALSSGILYVSLTTGVLNKESSWLTVIPVHAEFTAKEMVIDREGL